ncbi:MAG: YscO family type III secretion system apparatus protein [Chlamydiales bacterium]|nr:YscO family type III secretion system apparatus protein [Chlamydiales bacterium]
MKKLPPYPLEQLAEIKQKRLEEAEKELKHKKHLLDVEKQKLIKREEERDQVKAHKADKLQQMNDKFDEGITSDEIEIMRRYLKVVDEKLKGKEVKVLDQKKQVTLAEKAVEDAKKNLVKKQTEIEKIRMHKEEWTKEMKVLMEQEEEKVLDELGSVAFVRKKHQKE